ncbi:MAG: DUF721 domain-containing protein [Myxococcales bacterium]|nr:DUF721 domain-containing protein [Myxococcales bacterium]
MRLADVVRSMLNLETNEKRKTGHRVLRVFEAFRKLGPPLTRRAEPIWYGRGVLTLRVFGSVWMTELSFLAPQIVRRVNERLPEPWVESLRLRAGAVPAASERSEPVRRLTSVELERIEGLGAVIPRTEVKVAVMRAAAAQLGRITKADAPEGMRERHPPSRPGSDGSSPR